MELERRFGRKLAATVMVVLLQFITLPHAATAPSLAGIHGVVVSGTSSTPLAGATVHVADPARGEIFTSQRTASDGHFVVEDLPAATYEVAVELDGGLYLLETALRPEAGKSQQVNLLISKDGKKGGEKAAKGKISGVWDNPLTATLIVVGSIFGVGLVVTAANGDDSGGGDVASPIE